MTIEGKGTAMAEMTFTDEERASILDEWCAEMIRAGWRVESRAAHTAAIVKGTRLWAVLGTVLLLLPAAWMAAGTVMWASVRAGAPGMELLAVAAGAAVLAAGGVWIAKARRRRVGTVGQDGRVAVA